MGLFRENFEYYLEGFDGGEDEITVHYDIIVHQTEGAYLFNFDGTEIWIPKSRVVEIDAEEQSILIPMWLAKDKGLV